MCRAANIYDQQYFFNGFSPFSPLAFWTRVMLPSFFKRSILFISKGSKITLACLQKCVIVWWRIAFGETAKNEWITQCKVLQCYNARFINRSMVTYARTHTHTAKDNDCLYEAVCETRWSKGNPTCRFVCVFNSTFSFYIWRTPFKPKKLQLQFII